jgi:crotonobetaine/carnitine-CoA ligase
MTTAIYSEPEQPNDANNPVRLVLSAGMPKVLWDRFQERFGVEILEFYGAAEGGLLLNPPGAGPAGSIGKPLSIMEARIADENGRECPPGEPGEIQFRNADGTAPVVQYFNNPEASAGKTEGGWLHMGDIGYRDADGWFYFLYREGGGIRRNGEFVSPAFIERELAEHPLITDVFVYGVATPESAPGEKEVVAAVVPVPGKVLDPRAVFHHCRARLEANVVPGFLQVVDEIPKTASEKPQERFLLEAFDMAAGNVYAESNS